MNWRTGFVGAIAAASALTLNPATAAAHQPLFLGSEHATPDAGPRIVDGTISFAIYGTLDSLTATRGVRFSLQDGDPLFVEILIPDLEPERTLRPEHLPTFDLIAPDGGVSTVSPQLGEPFDEPFSGTRYIRLGSLSGDGTEGIYGLSIRGGAPARFTAVIGRRETFGEVDGSGADGSVAEWWATAPPDARDVPVASTDGDGTAETLGVLPAPSETTGGPTGEAFDDMATAEASAGAEREPAVQINEPAASVVPPSPATESATGDTIASRSSGGDGGLNTAINVGIGVVIAGGVALAVLFTRQLARQRRGDRPE